MSLTLAAGSYLRVSSFLAISFPTALLARPFLLISSALLMSASNVSVLSSPALFPLTLTSGWVLLSTEAALSLLLFAMLLALFMRFACPAFTPMLQRSSSVASSKLSTSSYPLSTMTLRYCVATSGLILIESKNCDERSDKLKYCSSAEVPETDDDIS